MQYQIDTPWLNYCLSIDTIKTAVHSEMAVTAYFSIEELRLFGRIVIVL